MFLENHEIDFQMRSMQLQGDGLDTALLIKVFAYLLARRLASRGVFSKLTITEIMCKWRREEDLREFLGVHLPHCGMQDEDQLRQDLSMMFLTEISTRTLSIMSTRLMGRRVSPTDSSNST